jgi:ActR/RegA family two-component response regulator
MSETSKKLEPFGGGRRVLVYDEEAVIRDVFTKIMSRAGFEAEGFSEAASGFAALEAGPAPLLLVNVSITNPNWPSLVRFVRERMLETRVIFVDARWTPCRARRAVALGAHRYLAIPLQGARMLEIIQRLPLAPDPLCLPADDDPALMNLGDATRTAFLEAFRYWHPDAKVGAAPVADGELWPRLGHGGSS